MWKFSLNATLWLKYHYFLKHFIVLIFSFVAYDFLIIFLRILVSKLTQSENIVFLTLESNCFAAQLVQSEETEWKIFLYASKFYLNAKHFDFINVIFSCLLGYNKRGEGMHISLRAYPYHIQLALHCLSAGRTIKASSFNAWQFKFFKV